MSIDLFVFCEEFFSFKSASFEYFSVILTFSIDKPGNWSSLNTSSYFALLDLPGIFKTDSGVSMIWEEIIPVKKFN